jgi:hypothetical protein
MMLAEMNPQLLHEPFFQVTLPLMGTIIIATWAMVSVNNKRFDDVMRRLDRIETRLDNIEGVLRDFAQRITRLKERTSPIHL